MNRNHKAWKKNLRILPAHLLDRIRLSAWDDWIASCVISILPEQIKSGRFSHLGLVWKGDRVEFPSQVVPPAEVGRYSRSKPARHDRCPERLAHDNESLSIMSPNYGDWSKGWHSSNFEKPMYRRDQIGPKVLPIQIEQIGEDAVTFAMVFRFTIPEVLRRTDPGL